MRRFTLPLISRPKAKLISLLVVLILPLQMGLAQQTTERLQREVRLYNPFRPTLSEARKVNLLPDLADTTRVKPVFSYTVTPTSFTPAYTISAIRPATLLPDPLPKLYKSYLKLGIGNRFTPLGELAIASERSRNGLIAFHANHFSSNGKVKLDNDQKSYAGYMDNEASLYGKRLFQSSQLSGSVDFEHLTRHAYGFDTAFTDYEPEREDTRLQFIGVGAETAFSSLVADSSRLTYDFRLGYKYFRQSDILWDHRTRFSFDAGTSIASSRGRRGSNDFYARVKGGYELTILNSALEDKPRHTIRFNPTLGKKTDEWQFNLGLKAVTETRYFLYDEPVEWLTKFHIYPDVSFSLTVIPSYLRFRLSLDGRLEDNSASSTARINPFLQTSGYLFQLPSTSHQLRAGGEFSGSLEPATLYRLGANFSVLSDMVFFSNVVWSDISFAEGFGSHFMPEFSDGNLTKVYASLNSELTGRLSATLRANYYNYSLTSLDMPVNKPPWDGRINLDYNLQNKIIAGAGVMVAGKREAAIVHFSDGGATVSREQVELPVAITFNLTAEYRFTKILSFWLRADNINLNRHYEWALYPSQKLIVMGGFSYSL